MYTFAWATGFRYVSSAVISTPSGPARRSSNVIGLRSGPGSATTPDSDVPGRFARLTVVNRNVSLLPGVPVPAASSRDPSAARMVEPSMVTVIVEPPGIGFVKNSQAKVPPADGTMVAASFAPVVSVAKKLLPLSIGRSIARENVTFGRYVEP